MKTKVQYRQCRLVKHDGKTKMETVSWLPTKVKTRGGYTTLKVGSVVSLRDGDDWDRDWVVDLMSEEIVDEAPDFRKLIKGHRKMTGDSWPRT